MKKIFVISLLLLLSTLGVQEANAQSTPSTDISTEITIKPSLEATISVFPNPAVDYIIVQINKDQEILSPIFELYSLIGSSVKIDAEPIAKNQYRIPVDHTKKGYYFVVVKDEVTRSKIAHKFLKN